MSRSCRKRCEKLLWKLKYARITNKQDNIFYGKRIKKEDRQGISLELHSELYESWRGIPADAFYGQTVRSQRVRTYWSYRHFLGHLQHIRQQWLFQRTDS